MRQNTTTKACLFLHLRLRELDLVATFLYDYPKFSQ